MDNIEFRLKLPEYKLDFYLRQPFNLYLEPLPATTITISPLTVFEEK